MFEANLEENLDSSMRDLKTRDKFMPEPLRRVVIPKGKGKLPPHRTGSAQATSYRLSSSLCSMRIRFVRVSTRAQLSSGAGAGTVALATRVPGCPGCRYSRLLRQYPARGHHERFGRCGGRWKYPRIGRALSTGQEHGQLVMDNGVFEPTTVGTYAARRRYFSAAGQYRPELPGLATGQSRTALRALCQRLRRHVSQLHPS